MGERSDQRAADEREPDGAAVGLFWLGIEAHARMAGLTRWPLAEIAPVRSKRRLASRALGAKFSARA